MKISRRQVGIARALPVLLAVALGAAASAPRAGATAPSNPGPVAQAAATARPPVEVSFRQSWLPNPEWAPFVVGLEKGLYEKEGVQLKLQTGSGSSTAVKLVGTGEDPIGHADASAVIVGLAQGVPITPVATLNQLNATALISFEEQNIRGLKDIMGKRFAETAASFTYGLFVAAMHNQGLDPNSVRLVNIEPAARNQTFLAGKVDAMLVLMQNELVDVEKRAAPRKIRSLPLFDLGVRVPGKVIIVNNKFLQEKPEVVKAFLRATAKASAIVKDNPAEAADTMARRYPELPKDTLLEKVTKDQQFTWTPVAVEKGWGYQDPKTWGDLEKFMLDAKLLPKKVDIGTKLTQSFLPAK